MSKDVAAQDSTCTQLGASRGCLDDDTVTALFSGGLEETQVGMIDAHFASCARCRRLVATMARDGSKAPAGPEMTSAPSFDDLRPSNEAGWLAALAPIATEVAKRNAERRIGTVLAGKWKIDSLLGAGGMAQVFAATHQNGRKVALKILRTELGTDAELVRRFMLEAYAANRVEHPGVITILDNDVTDDGCPFLVMEKLEGETLRERLERGPLDIPEAIKLGECVLAILAAAHARDVVHRDIKPENVFLTRDGDVKLLDFGIARMRALAAQANTRTGLSLGTPAYMAPEQARGESARVDARADLWAVGATLFRAVSGRTVHLAEGERLLFLAMTQPAPRLSDVVPRAPESFTRVVDRALAFERDDRWESATSMREALLAPHVRAPRGRRRAASLAALCAFALASLGLVRWSVRPARDAAPELSAPSMSVTDGTSSTTTSVTATPSASVADPAPSGVAPPTALTPPRRPPSRGPSKAESRATASAPAASIAASSSSAPPMAPNTSGDRFLDRRH